MAFFDLTAGEGPLVATAIHNGHAVRADVAPLLALDAAARLREEDPFTDQLAALAPTHVIGRHSRFEVDLNRYRRLAVYLNPDDAWGLSVWREAPSDAMVAESIANHKLFYATVRGLLDGLLARYGRVVVLDLHSYNHRREGADRPAAPEAENPEINLGTATVDRAVWGPLVDRFVADLRRHDFRGRTLDVRENVKFQGGRFVSWIHERFPGRVCALAIEFKKTFMDEWTGELDRAHFTALQAALASTFPGLLASLNALSSLT